MERLAVLWVTPLIVLIAVACSQNEETSGQKPFNVEEVRAAFKAATGDELVVRGTLTVIPEWGKVVALDVRPEASHKYGEFGIRVFENPERLKRATRAAGDKPDERSISWRYTPINEEGRVPTWSAAKNYENVSLVWINDAKQTDARWGVLDGAMQQLLREG